MQSMPGIGLVELIILLLIGIGGLLVGGIVLVFGKFLLSLSLGLFKYRTRRIGMSGHLLHPQLKPCGSCGAALTSKLPVCSQCGQRVRD